MESLRGYISSLCKYSLMAALLAAASCSADAVAGEAEGKDISGRSFCVVLRPDVKPSPGAERTLVGEHAGEVKPVRERGKSSFFEGSVRKLGFGAPDCFFINREIQNNPLTGEEGLHAGPTERLEAMAAEREGRDFFPAAGYFNRTSLGKHGGLAIGAGLAGSSALDGADGAIPEAKVSLMFGFGF